MCDHLLETLECNILDWHALYEPLHQFGGSDSFQIEHCGKT
jgi:hypothetical protein